MTQHQGAETLGAARRRFEGARRAVRFAEERAERARIEVARTKAVVSAHGDVVGQMTAWSASQGTFDLGPAELPHGLAQARRRLTVSQEEHERADRLLQSLEQEAQQLRQAANLAAEELRAVMNGALPFGEQSVS